MTPVPTVNLLVIGRSPRPALKAEFRRVLGDGCDLRTIGALDRLDAAEIAAHPPQSDADTLFTILPDGQSALISKAFVAGELRARVTRLEPRDGHIDVLCCTGKFREFEHSRIITASEVLLNTIRGLGTLASNLGVFIPKPQQVANATDRWVEGGFGAAVVPLAPDASGAEIDTAAELMRDRAPDVVVYDCISYNHAARLRIRNTCNAPAVVASSTLAHVVAELLAI